ncbi:Heterokaryon incompatibility [Macrophomina phaseolina MS6]|uniref:Heterokaryon incompatibility n=1 Tax=Macrophomina phaseolina (strain MS6) TaxID=1126212 RepID=K2SK10_MACPH|nr:Heterokaryon incompatibility [Macrophomina phaseolina MS6]
MLCSTCACMLRGGTEQLLQGDRALVFRHHTRTESLRRSREGRCSICVALANELRDEIDLFNDQDISVEASLSELMHGEWANRDVYRLDFVLEKRRTRTFVLSAITYSDWSHKTHDDTYRWLRTPKSYHTSSDEVFNFACSWIKKCTCAAFWDSDSVADKWYPKRLLDLRGIRHDPSLHHANGIIHSMNANLDNTKIKLIETRENEWHKLGGKKYVTLSHCWGTPRSVERQLKLTAKTETEFRASGIELRSFPKSFQDAIRFACRLPGVDYIWIDSMCIIQNTLNPDEDQAAAEQDWREQSSLMHEVYRRSYLNISATAASDSDKGLFFPRKPESLWEDEVNLNLVGLMPGLDHRDNADPIRRCTITDVSFWDELVNNAPINQRAWVLQERLLAPRVLHFCADRIAWECSELNAAEGHPEGVGILTIRSGAILDEGRLKSLTLDDGRKLRNIRLNGFPDPDEGMENLYSFEIWKRIVEVYSRTKLTMPRDKLIALSGIARMFFEEQLTKKNVPGVREVSYVVGMWSQYLESQLLWRMEPVLKDGSFENHAIRHPLRAPSFSWACLDAPQGIVYGEATDYEGKDRVSTSGRSGRLHEQTGPLLFKVENYSIDLWYPKDQFGHIKGDKTRLKLRVQYLRSIILRKLAFPRRVPYAWRLSDSEDSQVEHTNVYLDAPGSDEGLFSNDRSLYVMPAAWGERTVKESSRYLMCLILKHDGEQENCKRFTRVGLTKLSNHMEQKGQEAVLKDRTEETIYLF